MRDLLISHVGVSWWRVSATKTNPSQACRPEFLADWEFFTPSRSVGGLLVVDIDRPTGVLDAYGMIPPEIAPTWVVETPGGAQAGWLIDPVDLRPAARDHPVRYARAVGGALRAAVGADPAVDPLTPARVRNPGYRGAEIRTAEVPPVYRLGDLHDALRAAGRWAPPRMTPQDHARAAVDDAGGTIPPGERNVSVFDATRFAAYRGDSAADAAARTAERCHPPLPASEVAGIVRSVERYMHRTGRTDGLGEPETTPQALRDTMAEIGRAGGLRASDAQKAARARGPEAASVVRQTEAVGRAAMAVHLSETEHLTAQQIADRLGCSRDTVRRALRAHRKQS